MLLPLPSATAMLKGDRKGDRKADRKADKKDGRKDGRKDGKRMLWRCCMTGVAVEQIVKWTGLSLEEVKTLRRELDT